MSSSRWPPISSPGAIPPPAPGNWPCWGIACWTIYVIGMLAPLASCWMQPKTSASCYSSSTPSTCLGLSMHKLLRSRVLLIFLAWLYSACPLRLSSPFPHGLYRCSHLALDKPLAELLHDRCGLAPPLLPLLSKVSLPNTFNSMCNLNNT